MSREQRIFKNLRVVRTRAERAAREAALLAGTACDFCGDEGRVELRRVCNCEDSVKSMEFTSLVEKEGEPPVCSACWTPAFEHRLCEGCRIRGGEEVEP